MQLNDLDLEAVAFRDKPAGCLAFGASAFWEPTAGITSAGSNLITTQKARGWHRKPAGRRLLTAAWTARRV